jgi:uncharacterized protein
MLSKLRKSRPARKNVRGPVDFPAGRSSYSRPRVQSDAASNFQLKGYVMHKQIFVNLPVKDLEKSKAFFAALGFTFNPQYTDQNAACMVISDGSIYAMLLVEEFFKTFTAKPIVTAHEATEVLTCLSCDTRAEVDDLVSKAIAAGGKAPRDPQDYGFMYSHGFEDLDGHIWELAYMSGEPPQQ